MQPMANDLQISLSSAFRCRPISNALYSVLSPSDQANILSTELLDDTCDLRVQSTAVQPRLTVALYAIILVPSNIEETSRQSALARVEALVATHKNGIEHSNVAVVFVALETTTSNHETNHFRTDVFTSLQALLFDSPSVMDVPTIMLARFSEIIPALISHYTGIQHSGRQSSHISFPPAVLPNGSALYLLEFIVRQGPSQRACQHHVNVLSDLFPSLRALSAAIRSEKGRLLIADYVGDEVASHIVSFWEEDKRLAM